GFDTRNQPPRVNCLPLANARPSRGEGKVRRLLLHETARPPGLGSGGKQVDGGGGLGSVTDIPLASVLGWLERLAPLALAESWDNVGLLVGDRQNVARRVMTCLT